MGKCIVVGIHGFKGVGKDTVADIICGYFHGSDVVRIAYADQLKHGLYYLLDVPLDNFYLHELKEQIVPKYGMSPRQMMTEVNDWAIPLFGQEVFTGKVKSMYRQCKDKVSLMLVTDVRFDGRETNWIREEGGLILHVHRPEKEAGAHASEAGVGMKDGDYVITNDGGLWDLRDKVTNFMEYLVSRYRQGNWKNL